MNTFSVKAHFEQQYRDIFKKDGPYGHLVFPDTQQPVVEPGFHSVDHIPVGGLLYVGLNPSDRHGVVESNFYDVHLGLPANHPYWKAFSNLSHRITSENEQGPAQTLNYGHLDMLVVRETQQSLVRDLLRQKGAVDFMLDQIALAKNIMERVKPKIIVVTNTFARELMGKMRYKNPDGTEHLVWMGLDFYFDQELGVDCIATDGPLYSTPVFFSSMISGQRALDLGSMERLVWHIKRVNQFLYRS